VKICYFVLGMHRSGTSTIAGIMNMIGINTGMHLLEPQECNPKGFFENAAIADFNERLYNFLCAEWFDTLRIPEKWWMNDLVAQYYKELQKIIETEFNDSVEILVKDPRICVLLPFYLALLSRMGVDCRFVIIFRNPLDVAASLEYRDNFSSEHAQLLWMDHVLKSEVYTRGFSRIFIWYPEVVGDPVHVTRMLINKWNLYDRLSFGVEQRIIDFVDPKLMHFRSRTVLTGIPEINVVYNALLKMRNGGESENRLNILHHSGMNFRKFYNFYHGFCSKPEARLNVKAIDGSRILIKKPVSYGNNLIEFDLTQNDKIVSIVFNPCNMPVCFKINSIMADAIAGADPIVLSWNVNADINENGIISFNAENKEVIINTEGFKGIRILAIDITYVGFGKTACCVQGKRKHARLILSEEKFTEMENRLTELKSRFNEQQNEKENLFRQIEELKSSYTWKTGSLLLYPVKYVHRIISKIK